MAVNKTELPSSKGNGGEEELDAIVVKTGDNFMLEYEVFANKRGSKRTRQVACSKGQDWDRLKLDKSELYVSLEKTVWDRSIEIYLHSHVSSSLFSVRWIRTLKTWSSWKKSSKATTRCFRSHGVPEYSNRSKMKSTYSDGERKSSCRTKQQLRAGFKNSEGALSIWASYSMSLLHSRSTPKRSWATS